MCSGSLTIAPRHLEEAHSDDDDSDDDDDDDRDFVYDHCSRVTVSTASASSNNSTGRSHVLPGSGWRPPSGGALEVYARRTSRSSTSSACLAS